MPPHQQQNTVQVICVPCSRELHCSSGDPRQGLEKASVIEYRTDSLLETRGKTDPRMAD